jgi:hypothetical protein
MWPEFNIMLISAGYPASTIQEIVKTGGGVIFGFLLGLFADPLKTWIKIKIDVREG